MEHGTETPTFPCRPKTIMQISACLTVPLIPEVPRTGILKAPLWSATSPCITGQRIFGQRWLTKCDLTYPIQMQTQLRSTGIRETTRLHGSIWLTISSALGYRTH